MPGREKIVVDSSRMGEAITISDTRTMDGTKGITMPSMPTGENIMLVHTGGTTATRAVPRRSLRTVECNTAVTRTTDDISGIIVRCMHTCGSIQNGRTGTVTDTTAVVMKDSLTAECATGEAAWLLRGIVRSIRRK
jgi:hypothetical protein